MISPLKVLHSTADYMGGVLLVPYVYYWRTFTEFPPQLEMSDCNDIAEKNLFLNLHIDKNYYTLKDIGVFFSGMVLICL